MGSYLLKPGMWFLNPWNSVSGMKKGRKLKIGPSFTQSRTSLNFGEFNYCVFNHPVTAPRDGHHGMSAMGTGWHECIWSQAPAFQKSSDDGAEEKARCASHQSWLQPMPRTLCHPHCTLGMSGTAVRVSGNRDSLAGPGSSLDGSCHVLTSSRGFQGIRVIKCNHGGAIFSSVFPPLLSRFLRK